MSFEIIKSYAKINLSLNVIKRKSNNYHEIESLVTFVKFSDKIKIKRINKKTHNISFSGSFSKEIKKKNNTVIKLLKLLEKNNFLKKKFKIQIIKNIPQRSGMGGGSMNAASILKYLMKKKMIKISNKKSKELAYKIGSDVILGLENKNMILFKNGKTAPLNNKLNFHVLIVMPKFGCSTKNIFSRVKNFSKPMYFRKNKGFFKTKNIIDSNNDLEHIVFSKNLKIKNLKLFLSQLPSVVFTRMTGSGSALVAYFKSKKTAKNAAKIFKSKYNGYWYTISKTI
tara:strand:+ start:876 stop:1724 length:849 start_codon:yes stop_codon:yes gene_type:complete